MEKDYDDRSFVINKDEKYMLSDLTDKERDIYFAGVNEGMIDGVKLSCYFILIVIVITGAVSFILTTQK